MSEMRTPATSDHSERLSYILVGIWHHLSRRRKVQAVIVLALMLASGFAELLSLGAVLPFLAVLTYPERLWNAPFVQRLISTTSLNTPQQLIIPITLIFIASVVLSSIVRLASLWINGRYAAGVGSDLSCEAYSKTLYQPYISHTLFDTAGLITAMTSQVIRTVSALTAILQLTASALVALGLIVGLMAVSWRIASFSAILFGLVYLILALTTRRKLITNSKLIANNSVRQIKTIQDSIGAIREIILSGSQVTYIDAYRMADQPQRYLQVDNVFMGTFPRYAVEGLGLVVIGTLGGIEAFRGNHNAQVIPLLGALALGAQRLLPALQVIYSSWSSLKSYVADLSGLLGLLNQSVQLPATSVSSFGYWKSIELVNVEFTYDPLSSPVLTDCNLHIQKGERVGFVGATGSGKSTMLDIIIGLLPPTKGRFCVDGLDLWDPLNQGHLFAWRSSISHVPQNIYLSDKSVAENIAIGLDRENIDMDRVRHAAQCARIDEFIETSLGGYGSLVGERGIRLSGGQRQRIAIARALYNRSSILVLDEATSALDEGTESSIMDAIYNLSSDITILMITHRVSIVKRCDRIVTL